MKNRKLLSLLTAAAMTAGALGGCGGGGTQTTAAAPEAQAGQKTEAQAPDSSGGGADSAGEASMYEVTEPVTIEYWYNSAVNEDFYNKLAEDFNSSQEYVTVVPDRKSVV